MKHSIVAIAIMSIGLGAAQAQDVVKLGNAAPLFPYTQPALFAMPLAFLCIYVFSKLDNSEQARMERAAFDDQYVRAQTGVGAASAAAH